MSQDAPTPELSFEADDLPVEPPAPLLVTPPRSALRKALDRRWRLNVALALLAAVLAIVVSHTRDRDAARSRLTELVAAEVSRIEVARQDEAPVRLQRDQKGWQLREPVAMAADPKPIEQLLLLTGAEVRQSFPAAALDLGAIGLDPAAVRVRLDDRELAFGDLGPIGEMRYVQVGELVHLIQDRYSHLLQKPALAFADKVLLPPGFRPRRASINGRPLSPTALERLSGLRAERLEPFTGDLSGLVLKVEDNLNPTLRYMIGSDGRSWTRLDKRLTYVFPSAPILESDEDEALELDTGDLPDPLAKPPQLVETPGAATDAEPLVSDGSAAPPTVELSAEGEPLVGEDTAGEPPTVRLGVDQAAASLGAPLPRAPSGVQLPAEEPLADDMADLPTYRLGPDAPAPQPPTPAPLYQQDPFAPRPQAPQSQSLQQYQQDPFAPQPPARRAQALQQYQQDPFAPGAIPSPPPSATPRAPSLPNMVEEPLVYPEDAPTDLPTVRLPVQ